MYRTLVFLVALGVPATAQAQCSKSGGSGRPRSPVGNTTSMFVYTPTTQFTSTFGNPGTSRFTVPFNPGTFVYGMPCTSPVMPGQCVTQQFVYPQTTTGRLDPVAKTSSLFNPIVKPSESTSETLLVKSTEEKDTFVRNALRRGREAEENGNRLLARVCYENACLLYPDSSLVTQARAALERVDRR